MLSEKSSTSWPHTEWMRIMLKITKVARKAKHTTTTGCNKLNDNTQWWLSRTLLFSHNEQIFSIEWNENFFIKNFLIIIIFGVQPTQRAYYRNSYVTPRNDNNKKKSFTHTPRLPHCFVYLYLSIFNLYSNQ